MRLSGPGRGGGGGGGGRGRGGEARPGTGLMGGHSNRMATVGAEPLRHRLTSGGVYAVGIHGSRELAASWATTGDGAGGRAHNKMSSTPCRSAPDWPLLTGRREARARRDSGQGKHHKRIQMMVKQNFS